MKLMSTNLGPVERNLLVGLGARPPNKVSRAGMQHEQQRVERIVFAVFNDVDERVAHRLPAIRVLGQYRCR